MYSFFCSIYHVWPTFRGHQPSSLTALRFYISFRA